MDNAWIAVAVSMVGVGFAVLGGLIHVVWKISRMSTQIDVILQSMERDGKCLWDSLGEHANKLGKHDVRIARIEATQPPRD